jgi:hypothetical protein
MLIVLIEGTETPGRRGVPSIQPVRRRTSAVHRGPGIRPCGVPSDSQAQSLPRLVEAVMGQSSSVGGRVLGETVQSEDDGGVASPSREAGSRGGCIQRAAGGHGTSTPEASGVGIARTVWEAAVTVLSSAQGCGHSGCPLGMPLSLRYRRSKGGRRDYPYARSRCRHKGRARSTIARGSSCRLGSPRSSAPPGCGAPARGYDGRDVGAAVPRIVVTTRREVAAGHPKEGGSRGFGAVAPSPWAILKTLRRKS